MIDVEVNRSGKEGLAMTLVKWSPLAELEAMEREGALARASLLDIFGRLLAKGERVDVIYIAGNWLDVDDVFDLAEARNFL